MSTIGPIRLIRGLSNFIKQPYPYYIPFSRSARLLLILSLIVPAFLIIFQPFNINQWNCEYKTVLLTGLIIPIYVTLAFNFYVVSKVSQRFFNEEAWTIGSEIIWSIWNFLTIVLTTTLYWKIIPVCHMSGVQWGQQFLAAFLIGLFPGIFCIYFNYSRALKRKLKKATVLNDFLKSKVAIYEEGTLKLISENETEKFKVSTKNLLFIQAQDNYSKIVYLKDGDLQSILLRSSLKNIERQITYPFIVRCNRSYIVNLSLVNNVTGNARDYKLMLDGYEIPIPVSRESYKQILNLFDDYSPNPNDSGGIVYKAG